MSAFDRIVSLLWLCLPLLAIYMLMRFGDLSLFTSLGELSLHQPTAIAFAAFQVIALIGCSWISLGTLMQLVSTSLNRDWHSLLPGRISRWNHRMFLVFLTGSLALPSTASATTPAPVIRNITPVDIEPVVQPNDETRNQPESATTVTPETNDTAPTSNEYTTVAGDNFWIVAEKTLTQRGQTIDAKSLAAYWQRLVDLNSDRLLDPANPDLIRPGQTFLLPA